MMSHVPPFSFSADLAIARFPRRDVLALEDELMPSRIPVTAARFSRDSEQVSVRREEAFASFGVARQEDAKEILLYVHGTYTY